MGQYLRKSFTLAPDGSLYAGSDRTLARLDPKTGEKLWEKKFDRELDTFPAVTGEDGSLYVCTTDSHLRRLDPATGEQKWEFDMDVRGGALLIGDDGTVYTQYKDDMFALTPGGKKKWRFRINDYMHDVSAVAKDGTVYSTTKKGLYAVKPNGWQKWLYAADKGSCTLSPDGNLYHCKYGESLASLDPETGKEKWKIPLGEAYVRAGKDGKIFVEGYSELSALDPADGKILWSLKNSSHARIRAIDGRGTIITGSEDKKITALDPSDGKEIWSVPTQNKAEWGEAEFDRSGVLFINDRKQIYGIDPQTGKVHFTYQAPGEIAGFRLDQRNGLILIEQEGTWQLSAVSYFSAEGKAKEMLESTGAGQAQPEVVEGPGFVVIGGVKLGRRSGE
jgi:outer membrane protein assembly factor BamB